MTLSTSKAPASHKRPRLSAAEKLARADGLVDDCRIDGKRFKGEAPIIKQIRKELAKKGVRI